MEWHSQTQRRETCKIDPIPSCHECLSSILYRNLMHGLVLLLFAFVRWVVGYFCSEMLRGAHLTPPRSAFVSPTEGNPSPALFCVAMQSEQWFVCVWGVMFKKIDGQFSKYVRKLVLSLF